MLKQNIIVIIAFIVFGISAFFNKGFYQPDEHYQIVEFAELKNGNNQAGDLAWEYAAKIRPAIQPLIFYAIINTLGWLHLTDPYTITVIGRLIVAMLSLVVISLFTNVTINSVDIKFRKHYVFLSYFLCFIPFIGIRFSSENFSALSFLFGLYLLHKPISKNTYYLLGICLGLSFLFRFQTALMSIGLLLWLFYIYKLDIYNLVKIVMGALLVVNIGTLIDYWYYGVYTFTFVNYFSANIVDDVASSFGTFPWYYYINILIATCKFPLAFILMLSILIQLFFNPKNMLVWVIVPFLFIHFITPHKELRFLFPIGNLMPLMIVSSIQLLSKRKFLNDYILKTLTVVFLLINTVGLIMNMFSPADEEGRMNITQFIHEKYHNRNVMLYYISYINPYKPITPNQRFYLDKNVTQHELLPETIGVPVDRSITDLLVIQKKSIAENANLAKQFKLKYLRSGVPEWVQELKHFFNFRDDGNSLELYEMQANH
jgi:phosphatidylinositol glycan class B